MSLSDALPQAPEAPISPKAGMAHPVRIFLIANFIYLWVVHVWGLWVPPLAVDVTVWDSYDHLPLLARVGLKELYHFTNASDVGMRIANLLLLYGCMVGVFFITKAVVKGPWWLGSLAAVLMMANPLKTEAMLATTGITAMLPAFLAITGIAFAVWPFEFQKERRRANIAGVFFVGLAMIGSPAYFLAPLVIICLQWCNESQQFSTAAIWVVVGVFGIQIAFLLQSLSFQPTDGLLSLFLTVYPIGLLPETAAALAGSFWLSVGAATLIVVAWLVLWRATRHPALLWCGLAAIILRVSMPAIDLVTMAGGGTMILPIALVAIGFAAVCHSILQHPAWPRHVVFLTTVLCLVLFGLQIRAIRAHAAEPTPAAHAAEVRL
jgi:hypothetical protein